MLIREVVDAASLEDPRLIQIRAPRPSSRNARNVARSLIEKFFALGALSSLIGGAVLGTHLWLVLNGKLQAPSEYSFLRSLHAYIQTYLFFGLFILGFFFQTATKVMKAPAPPNGIALGSIPLLFVGVFCVVWNPTSVVGPVLISAPFLYAAFVLLTLTRHGRADLREIYAGWMLLGFIGLGISPYFPVERPANAFLIVWLGVVPIVFATGQQFLLAFLGGSRLGTKLNRGLFACYATFLAALLLSRIDQGDMLCRVAGALGFLSILIYTLGTKSWAALRLVHREPLALAFLTGYFWALIATAGVALKGSNFFDSSFHIVVLGWLTPLIISVSTHVLRAIAGSLILSKRAVFFLLLLWQVLPAGRGLREALSLPASLSYAIAAVAPLVLIPWFFAVLFGAAKIARSEL